MLKLSHGTVQKSVYIQDGRIVFASSSDPDDRLGELLLRVGMVRLAQLEEVLGRLDSGKRLGTLLVEAGHLAPEKLVEGVLAQIQEIVLGLFTWEQGEYRFDESELPNQEVITLGMRTPEILMQGIRRIRSFVRIRRSVGPLRTVYRRNDDWEQALEGLELSEGEKLLVARLQDNSSIQELCDEVFLSNFEIYQTLWALKVLGVISEVDAAAGTARGASLEGLLDAEGIAPIMVRLCRSRETGVLYVSNGSRERTFHIREGNCVFATSNDIEDGLVAYLLRRGVISLQDREETAKRLLSNKRVGAILRQLGVIEDDELQDLVREQLSEIVFDTFHWQAGDYTFVSGDLPTVEEITLALSLESLVAAGQRRITSWTRIREGCGGLDRSLSLTRDYLEVLDRMSVGTEEWEVVSFLRQPTTPRQICSESRLDDFRVCQVLWTLRTLGAVECAEPAEMMQGAPVDPADEDLDASVVASGDAEPVALEVAPVVEDDAADHEPVEVEDEVAVEAEAESEAEARVETEAETHAADADMQSDVDEDAVQAEPEAEDPQVDASSPQEPVETGDSDAPDEDTFEGQGVEVSWQADEVEAEDPVEQDDDAEPQVDPAEQAIIESLQALPGSETGESTTYIPREAVERALRRADDDTAETEEPDTDEPAESEEPELRADTQVDAEADEAETEFEAAVEAEAEAAIEADADADADGADEAVEAVDAAPVDPYEDHEDHDDRVDEVADDGDQRYESSLDDLVAGSLAEAPVADYEAVDDAAAEPAAAPVEAVDSEDVPRDSTSEIPRAEVEAALEEEQVEQLPAFEPPEDLDFHIARLNARQKIVYRIIRTEVGAGAVNFVRSCATRLEADPLEGAEMRADGSWDADSLRQVVIERRVDDPGRHYGRLIEVEIDTLRDLIGEARASSLRRQVERVDTSVALESGRGMNTSRL